MVIVKAQFNAERRTSWSLRSLGVFYREKKTLDGNQYPWTLISFHTELVPARTKKLSDSKTAAVRLFISEGRA